MDRADVEKEFLLWPSRLVGEHPLRDEPHRSECEHHEQGSYRALASLVCDDQFKIVLFFKGYMASRTLSISSVMAANRPVNSVCVSSKS